MEHEDFGGLQDDLWRTGSVLGRRDILRERPQRAR